MNYIVNTKIVKFIITKDKVFWHITFIIKEWKLKVPEKS